MLETTHAKAPPPDQPTRWVHWEADNSSQWAVSAVIHPHTIACSTTLPLLLGASNETLKPEAYSVGTACQCSLCLPQVQMIISKRWDSFGLALGTVFHCYGTENESMMLTGTEC